MRSHVVISYAYYTGLHGSVVNPPFTTSRRNEAAVIKSMKGTMLQKRGPFIPRKLCVSK